MKAKEYAAQYEALLVTGSPVHPAGLIVKQMVSEVGTLQATRQAQTNSAMIAILREQERKWQAFCRIVGDTNLKPEGFREVIRRSFPSYVIELWERTERVTKVHQRC